MTPHDDGLGREIDGAQFFRRFIFDSAKRAHAISRAMR
jgi:hypothetical protein